MSTSGPWRIAGRRVLLPAGEVPAVLTVEDERIVAVEVGADAVTVAARAGATESAATRSATATETETATVIEVETTVIDAGDAVVMAGVVDMNVHVDHRQATGREAFGHLGRAAAAGGVTTVVGLAHDDASVTATPAAVAEAARALRACCVDGGLWGGAVPINTASETLTTLEALLAAGVLGIRCRLASADDGGMPPLDAAGLRSVMTLLARHHALLLVHAEWPAVLAEVPLPPQTRSAVTWAATRPPAAEVAAVRFLIDGCRATGCALHVARVAAAEVLPLLAAARDEGLPISADTSPHDLSFCAEAAPLGATTLKCVPPLRDARNREALWRGLIDGGLDLVASDHVPRLPNDELHESDDFMGARCGIASLQLLMPAVWTGMRARGIALARLPEWLCAAPAARAGLDGGGHGKGRLAVGYDADIVVWRPETSFQVESRRLQAGHARTPYDGVHLYGVVDQTFVRGRPVFRRGRFPGQAAGRWLRRGAP